MGIVEVKIGVLLVETNEFVKGVVGVNITLLDLVGWRRVGLLHRVIKKLELKSFFSSLHYI